jgi:S-adenosylmethionine:tRNA ribosyltransferase-isomerase
MRIAPDCWKAFIRGAKKLKPGDIIDFSCERACVESGSAGARVSMARRICDFDRSGGDLDAALALVGHVPLPPYIASKRAEDARDRLDYQTIYAREEGAVAAPTAGLHFTDELFGALDEAGIHRAFVTLHVGAGTFLPVKADDTDEPQDACRNRPCR